MKYLLHSQSVKTPTEPMEYDEALIVARALQKAGGLGSEVYICPLSYVVVSTEHQELLSHEAAAANNVTPINKRR